MLNVNDVNQIYLGVQGENLQQTIVIDVNPWLIRHPGGSVSIWHKRNGDSVPSATGAVFDDEAGTISWSPTSTDTYVSGEGEAEIRLTEGTIIKKTRSIRTGVSPAVTGGGQTLGSDWQSYIDEVDRIKGLAMAAKQAAETAQGKAEEAEAGAEQAKEDADVAVGHYPYVDPVTRTWQVWNVREQRWVNTGVKCEGIPGPKGDPGAQGERGQKGDPGEDGRNAVVIEIGAVEYYFQIDPEGHLIMTYGGDEAPVFYINNEGHLIHQI